jgi:cytochrome c551/c552
MRREIQSVVYATLLAGSALLSGCASVAKTAHPRIQKALYAYLHSLSSRHNDVPGARPHTAPAAPSAAVSTDALESGMPVRTSAPAGLARLVLAQATPKKDVDPAALFTRLGCTLCHAPGARYHDRIVKAASKPEQELAKWIRNPEQFVPGTAMPTYASLIDEPTALALARWIRSGGPSK